MGKPVVRVGIFEEGIFGEKFLMSLLKDRDFTVFQPDTLGYKNGRWYVFEFKHQDRFLSPPFDGHGLPEYQVKRRLQFQKDTGVIAVFMVLDKQTGEIFYQRFDVLEDKKYFDTKGDKKRRVYSLDSFILLPLQPHPRRLTG